MKLFHHLTPPLLVLFQAKYFPFQFVTRASGAQTVSYTAHVRMAPRVTQ